MRAPLENNGNHDGDILKKEAAGEMDDPSRTDDVELEECIRFHGHFCPGLAIGFRAARELMRLLGANRSGDEELVAIVETDACSADAIQVMTGCTFGKGNFIFLDHGKHAFTLGSRRRNMAYRASLRPDANVLNNEFAGLFEKLRSGSATGDERARFLKFRGDAAMRIIDMETGKLFKIEGASIVLPPKASVVRSETCPICQEPVRHDYLNDLEGTKACPSCREASGKPGKG